MACPADDAQVDVVGTVNVLEAARRVGARLVLCSTGGAIYGREAPIPSPETVLPLPESPYGIAKSCAEQYVGLYNRLHGARHAVLRFANVYGPRQDPTGDAGVIAIFCSRVLEGRPPTVYGDGKQTRDYVYVGDVVTALLAAADTGRPGTWNVGTGIETRVLDLRGHRRGRGPPSSRNSPRPGRASSRATPSRWTWPGGPGLEPRHPLADGIRAVYQWIQSDAPYRAGRDERRQRNRVRTARTCGRRCGRPRRGGR